MMCAAPLPFGPSAATACLSGIVAFLQDSRVFQLLLQSPDFRQCARRKNKTQQPEYKTATSHVTPPSLNEVPFTDRLHLPNRGSRITRCARSARQCYPCPRTKASPISPTVQSPSHGATSGTISSGFTPVLRARRIHEPEEPQPPLHRTQPP